LEAAKRNQAIGIEVNKYRPERAQQPIPAYFFFLQNYFTPLVMPRKSFSDLINSPGMPVLVDFYADWCGPCKTMAPILQQVAAQHEGKLRIIKIDVDKNPAVAQQFRVQSIPTLILFHKGQPVWRQAGVVPATQLTHAVGAYI
jgi:thioredoxin 1